MLALKGWVKFCRGHLFKGIYAPGPRKLPEVGVGDTVLDLWALS